LAKSALLIVDVQNDFCPGGALAVPNGDEVVQPLNQMIAFARAEDMPIIASRDWHPTKTSHFTEYGGLWPKHCLRDSPGATFHPELQLPPTAIIISKGIEKDENAYSAFEGLAEKAILLTDILDKEDVDTLYIGGLATDYCVEATVLDARRFGFTVYLLLDACRAINLHPLDNELSVKEMQNAGAIISSVQEIIHER